MRGEHRQNRRNRKRRRQDRKNRKRDRQDEGGRGRQRKATKATRETRGRESSPTRRIIPPSSTEKGKARMPKAMEAANNHRLEAGRNHRRRRGRQETAKRTSGREKEGMDGGREKDTGSIMGKKGKEGRGKDVRRQARAKGRHQARRNMRQNESSTRAEKAKTEGHQNGVRAGEESMVACVDRARGECGGQREGGGGRYWRRDRPGEGGRRRGQCT